jgi:cytochrome c553
MRRQSEHDTFKGLRFLILFLPAVMAAAPEFGHDIKPVLAKHCAACHNPANPRNRIDFLKADSATDIETRRNLWRNVSTQLRNRTMPPGANGLSEQDRLAVAKFIDDRLRSTGCVAGAYAGFVPPRRLNRREYRNTVRDLFGVELTITDLFPADESGGAGFDTNGDTLYLPPMMLERYLEAAKAVAERMIVAPPLQRVYLSHELSPVREPNLVNMRPVRRLAPAEEVTLDFTAYAEGTYNLRVSVERPRVTPFTIEVLADTKPAAKMSFARDSNGGATARVATAELGRGTHTVTLRNGAEPIDFYSLTVEQKLAPPSNDKRALHYRFFGFEAGETPAAPRATAKRILERWLPKAFRQPLDAADVDRFLALYDRSAQRGEPFEEGLKLALRGILVSPKFLFRAESVAKPAGIQPVGHYDMASRLSYFLWSTMPDEELLQLAAAGRLQDEAVLKQQLHRMLDDPRSRAFANSFMGQWLGTQEIGGRAVPLLTELQHFYTPEIAADLREQPTLFFHHIVQADRPLLDLLNGNYTFLTERLARYYEIEAKVALPAGSGFQRVEWPDNRRAGVLGLASVLAMTSHYKQASPVLRGAWVLDTILGTPVPPPPPDVPALEEAAKGNKKMSVREMLKMHRESTSCSACHNLMDPIGLGLEHFDWMGRWRAKNDDGSAVDASGTLPTGESFNGAVELRQLLLNRKEEFLRHLAGKTLGYALGRPIQDGDQCTIQRILDELPKRNYSARALLEMVVLSQPFRFMQPDAPVSESHAPATKKAPKRLLGTK